MQPTNPTPFLDAPRLLNLFEEIGQEFARRGEWAEIAIFGGAALLLHFGFRSSTRDVDYLPVSGASGEMAAITDAIGTRHGLPSGWFNDAVFMFVEHRREDLHYGTYPRFAQAGGLRVFLASPRYILAMKLKIMRSSFESHDVEDVWHLLTHCAIERAEDAEALVENFFPSFVLPERNRAILRDLLEARQLGRSYDPMMGW